MIKFYYDKEKNLIKKAEKTFNTNDVATEFVEVGMLDGRKIYEKAFTNISELYTILKGRNTFIYPDYLIIEEVNKAGDSLYFVANDYKCNGDDVILNLDSLANELYQLIDISNKENECYYLFENIKGGVKAIYKTEFGRELKKGDVIYWVKK